VTMTDNENSNMAAKTGNTYISESFSNRQDRNACGKSGCFDQCELEKVPAIDCDSNQQPEVAKLMPKSEIFISPEP